MKRKLHIGIAPNCKRDGYGFEPLSRDRLFFLRKVQVQRQATPSRDPVLNREHSVLAMSSVCRCKLHNM